MKKILVLGTGQAQADIIRTLAERNEYVYACSYIKGDVAEQFADEFCKINITDVDAVYDYVIKNNIEYIYSVGSDIAMPTVAAVAKKAGLKSFISYDTARICNTKTLLRDFLKDKISGDLKFQELSSIEEKLDLDFPFMLKPADSQGQRGVYKINTLEEYRNCFDLSKDFSRIGKVIIEEYADGTEISVNTFSVNGDIVFSLVSDRIVWEDYPGGIIHKHIIPSRYASDDELVKKTNDLVKQVLDCLNIQNGPAYFQIKITSNREPKLIEVTPRLDGCHMWRLIKYATGVDLLNLTIDLLLYDRYVPIGNYAVNAYETEFLCMPPSNEFSKHLFNIDNAEYLQWYYTDGQTVKKMNGYMEKCGYKIVKL